MVSMKLFALMSVVVPAAWAGAQATSSVAADGGGVEEEGGSPQWKVSTETDLPSARVSGAGKAQSSLTRPLTYAQNVGLFGTGRVRKLEWSTNIGLRGTSDRNVDPQPASLSNLRLELRQDRTSLSLGDTFSSFSSYSLGSPLKGAALKFGDEEQKGVSFTGVWGTADPRWRVFAPGTASDVVKRTAFGGKVQARLSENTAAGLSFLRSDDSGRVFATDPLYRNDIVALTAEHGFGFGWKLGGEVAWSTTRESPDSTTASRTYKGRGLKIEAAGALGKKKVTLAYEHVSPQFYSSLGAAQVDRERIRFRLREKWNKNVSASYGLLWYQNNLEGQRAFRTTTIRPELALNFQNFAGREEASLDFTVSSDNRYGGTNRNEDIDTMLTYRDVLAGWDTEWNVGVARYYSRASRDSREFTTNTSWYNRFVRGPLTYRPSATLGLWSAADHTGKFSDKTWEGSLGMGVEHPASRFGVNTQFGYRKAAVGQGDDNSRLFGNLSVTYRPQKWESFGGGLTLRVGWNDFRYTTAARDFRELTFGIGFTTQF